MDKTYLVLSLLKTASKIYDEVHGHKLTFAQAASVVQDALSGLSDYQNHVLSLHERSDQGEHFVPVMKEK
jgi:hypothetical protein